MEPFNPIISARHRRRRVRDLALAATVFVAVTVGAYLVIERATYWIALHV